ncbi:MAG TPA: gfo/Idh/MocA family oxidoreductase, partial [Planctomycetaceae bacterium]|nr:gfo/Idh/MocA family oxidoreductase [Planctomycetaceae bacterium]
IPDSPGHHKEWTNAIKTGSKTTSPFEYGGLLTESGLLGNVSYRAGQKKITWDPVAARVTDCAEADQYLHTEYRAGWTL